MPCKPPGNSTSSSAVIPGRPDTSAIPPLTCNTVPVSVNLNGGVRSGNDASIAATASGDGYWILAADGAVISFGDAQVFGALGDLGLSGPVASMAATASGDGYWILSADGAVSCFGEAPHRGSIPMTADSGTAIGLLDTVDGYLVVSSTGAVLPFGLATFRGRAMPQGVPIVDSVRVSVDRSVD